MPGFDQELVLVSHIDDPKQARFVGPNRIKQMPGELAHPSLQDFRQFFLLPVGLHITTCALYHSRSSHAIVQGSIFLMQYKKELHLVHIDQTVPSSNHGLCGQPPDKGFQFEYLFHTFRFESNGSSGWVVSEESTKPGGGGVNHTDLFCSAKVNTAGEVTGKYLVFLIPKSLSDNTHHPLKFHKLSTSKDSAERSTMVSTPTDRLAD